MISENEWHICEGLLSVFMKMDGSHSKQAIAFKAYAQGSSYDSSISVLKDISSNGGNGRIRTSTSVGREKKLLVLDMGSCKETISI